MEETRHAILSPSAAHRWLNCPAAPRLEETVPDTGSVFALEGTLAHALAAKKLKEANRVPAAREDEEIQRILAGSGLRVTGEMEEATDLYRDIVMERLAAAREGTPDARLMVEATLDLSNWIPDGFGTGDAVIVADNSIEVLDFKYGKGVKVDAEKNPQMMIYALGARDLTLIDYDSAPTNVMRMTIVQPRIGNVSTWEITVGELLEWGRKTLAPAASLAFSGAGRQVPGDWCRFCRVRATCRALAARCVAASGPDPRLMGPADLAASVLPQLPVIEEWVKSVKEYTLAQALDGVAYPGYKLVKGRGVRKITDQENAAKSLTGAGFSETDIYRAMELRTLTDLEKLVGKKRFSDLCGPYMEKTEGKPVLVTDEDKRPALNSAENDFGGLDL